MILFKHPRHIFYTVFARSALRTIDGNWIIKENDLTSLTEIWDNCILHNDQYYGMMEQLRIGQWKWSLLTQILTLLADFILSMVDGCICFIHLLLFTGTITKLKDYQFYVQGVGNDINKCTEMETICSFKWGQYQQFMHYSCLCREVESWYKVDTQRYSLEVLEINIRSWNGFWYKTVVNIR